MMHECRTRALRRTLLQDESTHSCRTVPQLTNLLCLLSKLRSVDEELSQQDRALLERIATRLLETETLDPAAFEEIVGSRERAT